MVKGKSMKRNKWSYIMCMPFLIAYGLFMVFPMAYSFYLSLYDYDGFHDKVFVGFQNYITLLTKDTLFGKSIIIVNDINNFTKRTNRGKPVSRSAGQMS